MRDFPIPIMTKSFHFVYPRDYEQETQIQRKNKNGLTGNYRDKNLSHKWPASACFIPLYTYFQMQAHSLRGEKRYIKINKGRRLRNDNINNFVNILQFIRKLSSQLYQILNKKVNSHLWQFNTWNKGIPSNSYLSCFSLKKVI